MAKAERASAAIGVRLAARLVRQIDPIRNRLPIWRRLAVTPGTAERFSSDTLKYFCVCTGSDSFKEVKATLQGPGTLPVRDGGHGKGDQQLADLSRASKLLLVDVRRQLVEARERALDQDIVSSLVGGSYGD